ncbi:MAG: DUF6404 family protein [Lentisphaerota bacterium]
MKYSEQVENYLAQTRAWGIGSWSAAPPVYRLLWRCKLPVPPPLCQSFRSLLISHTSFIVLGFIVLMGIFGWRQVNEPFVARIMEIIAIGIAAGLFLAYYFRKIADNYRVPVWSSFADTTGESSK